MITEQEINIAVYNAEYHYAILVDTVRINMSNGAENIDTTQINYIANLLEAMYVQIAKDDYTSETTIYFYNKLLDFLSAYSENSPGTDPDYQLPYELVVVIDNGFTPDDYVKKAGNPQTISSIITFTNPVYVPVAVSGGQALNLGQADARYQEKEDQRLSTGNEVQFTLITVYGGSGASFTGIEAGLVQIQGADSAHLDLGSKTIVFDDGHSNTLILNRNNITPGTYAQTYQDASGTIALLSNIPSVLPTPNAVIFNNSGSGAASGTTFDGSVARTISYNTIGAAPAIGGGYVSSVSGTTNRITSTGGTTPVIDISASYAGQASITILGMVNTGVWQGTAVADTYISSSSNWNTAYNNRIGTFTTTGSSGSATFSGNILNIPTYTLSGLGGAAATTTLTINGTAFDLSANRTWTVGDALVANPLSQFASTTSAQLRSILSDETGTGFAYFQGGDIGTPSAGVATNLTGTATTLNIGGNAATATILATTRAINGVNFNGSAAITITANTPNSVTFSNSGGASIGTTFNGGTARTISYFTVGALGADGGGSASTVNIGTNTFQANSGAGGRSFIGTNTGSGGSAIFGQATNGWAFLGDTTGGTGNCGHFVAGSGSAVYANNNSNVLAALEVTNTASGGNSIIVRSGATGTFVVSTTGVVNASGSVTASSLIKSGGTSSQFLKADGSSDSATYYKSGDSPSFVTITATGPIHINSTFTNALTLQTSGVDKTAFGQSVGADNWISGSSTGDAIISTQSKLLISANAGASSALAITGVNSLFNGTITAAGVITSTVGNNATIFSSARATTGWQQFTMANTSGYTFIGQEGSSAGTMSTGSLAYSTLIGSGLNKAFHLVANSTVGATLLGSGFFGVGYTSDPTGGMKFAVNGDSFFNGFGIFNSSPSNGLIIGPNPGGSNYGGLWATILIPSSSNYSFLTNSTNTVVRATTNLYLTISSTDIVTVTSAGIDVTGTVVADTLTVSNFVASSIGTFFNNHSSGSGISIAGGSIESSGQKALSVLSYSGDAILDLYSNRANFYKPINMKAYTVETLPTGKQGDTAYVTDALTPSFLVLVVGGGSTVTPVFYNGTQWVVY